MKNLILPVAGKSSRFPGMRPKWLLTMPDGQLMIEKSIQGIDTCIFDRIIVVCLKEHLDDFISEEILADILNKNDRANIEICSLDKATKSQSETVANALEKMKVEGEFFIKDCDNYFEILWGGGNEIATLDLNNVGLIDAKSKSYVNVDALGNVINIVEKEVVSNKFCCGGYGFESASKFLKYYYEIKTDKEIYISHVIYSMIMGGERFSIKLAENYIDWGTLREYRHYQKSYITLFCDVDGVLFFNGSKFSSKGWKTEPIVENLKAISKLQSLGQLYLIITTSRPEEEMEYIRNRLVENNVFPDKFVMGLPHGRRILINDFSKTNSYPTAISINIERDSQVLSSIIESIVQ